MGGQDGSTDTGPQHLPSPALDSLVGDREEEAPGPRSPPTLRGNPEPTPSGQILRKHENNNNNKSTSVSWELSMERAEELVSGAGWVIYAAFCSGALALSGKCWPGYPLNSFQQEIHWFQSADSRFIILQG